MKFASISFFRKTLAPNPYAELLYRGVIEIPILTMLSKHNGMAYPHPNDIYRIKCDVNSYEKRLLSFINDNTLADLKRKAEDKQSKEYRGATSKYIMYKDILPRIKTGDYNVLRFMP